MFASAAVLPESCSSRQQQGRKGQWVPGPRERLGPQGQAAGGVGVW